MTTRARTALTAGVLALTLVVMGAGFPAKTVPPKQWTGGLCTSLDAWRSVAVDGADQLKASLSGTQQVSLKDARSALSAYLADVADATEQARQDIKDLGAPHTPNGRKIERRLVKLFGALHGDVEELQDRASKMSTTREQVALRQVRSIQSDVNGVFDTFTKEFQRMKRLDSGRKIDKAFAASKACQTPSS
jgi:hypothetical protein